jgi:hypothetical protein
MSDREPRQQRIYERARKRYLHRKKQGLCNLCSRPPRHGKALCERCSWRHRLYRLRFMGVPEKEILKAKKAIENFDDVCQACGRTNQCGDWCLDHDHRTLKFRGIIGRLCNVVLGHSGDSPEILKRLARFLCRTK